MSLSWLPDERSTAGESLFLEQNENGIGEVLIPGAVFREKPLEESAASRYTVRIEKKNKTGRFCHEVYSCCHHDQ